MPQTPSPPAAQARSSSPAPSTELTGAADATRPTGGGVSLFFTFEAGIIPHYVTQCILARCLMDQGHAAVMLYCHGMFTRCPVFDMHGLPYDATTEAKGAICSQCQAHGRHLTKRYGVDVVSTEAHFGRAEERLVDEAMASPPQDLSRFTYLDVPFGQAVIMDMALATKRYRFDPADAAVRSMWEQYLRTALQSFLLAERLMDALPVRRTLRFNDYTILLGSHFAAMRRGVPAYHVTQPPHLGVNRRNVVIFPHVWPKCSDDNIAQWPAWRGLALPEAVVEEIGDDMLDRMQGRGHHTFSPPKAQQPLELLAQLGLTADKPILAAYTSSLDERVADEQNRLATGAPAPDATQPFRDQIEWLSALTEHVERPGELQLIVRIHPREGANKRDAIISEHYRILRQTFDKPYRACRFIWPEDPISSYDVGELADVILTSTGTLSLEFARMGARCLASVRGVNYPVASQDFRFVAATREAYFATLDRILAMEPDFDAVLHAFRFYHATRLGISLGLGDVIETSAFTEPPAYSLPREAEAIAAVIVEGQDITELNRARLAAMQGERQSQQERSAVQAQLVRALLFFVSGEVLTKAPPCASQDLGREAAEADAEAALERLAAANPLALCAVTAGNWLRLAHGGRRFRRFSPLGARLARLCGGAPGDAA